MVKRIGIGQPFPFAGGFNRNGEHESNPLANRSDDLGWPGFQGNAGRTDHESHRSHVDHFAVGHGPFVAHPLSGPGKSPHVSGED